MNIEQAVTDNCRAIPNDLNTQELVRYLREALVHSDAPIEVRRFSSGYSNLTFLVTAGAKEYVLRRPPLGVKIKSAHDVAREFRLLSAVQHCYSKIPKVLLLCEDHSIFGAPFFVMERVRGHILRLGEGAIEHAPNALRLLAEAMCTTLAEIHAIDLQNTSLDELRSRPGYMQRQVSGWSERFRKAATDNIPHVEHVMDWLALNCPNDVPGVLIHNDFKFDNVVLAPDDLTRVICVLDWEMATVGDPLADLGTMLSYWVEANDPPFLQAIRFGPTNAAGSFTRRELVSFYEKMSGRDCSAILYYYVFALFKLAVVAQQLYRRYVDAHTSEPRYAAMLQGARGVAYAAKLAIDRGTVG